MSDVLEIKDYKDEKSLRKVFLRVWSENNSSSGLVKYTEADVLEKVENICSRYSGTQYAFISHDDERDPEGKLKPSHFHIVIMFKTPVRFKYIKEVFPCCFVENMRSVNACIQYLTHKNNPEKTQYNFTDIISNMKDTKLEKLFTETTSEGKKKDPVLENIIQRIMSGEIKEYNRFKYIDDFNLVKYDRQIKIAFKNRSEVIMNETKKANVSRNIKVYFLEGSPGSGKTRIAKLLASQLGDGSYCLSGSKNDSIQDYKGENSLILDDLRDDAFEWDDFLKIIDNDTGSPIKSRYFNKVFLGTTIFITTNKPFEQWYTYTGEPLSAMRRRISYYYKVNENTLEVYQPSLEPPFSFEYINTETNPIPMLRAMEAARKNEDAKGMLSILSNVIGEVQKEFSAFADENHPVCKKLQKALEDSKKEHKKAEELRSVGLGPALTEEELSPGMKAFLEKINSEEVN